MNSKEIITIRGEGATADVDHGLIAPRPKTLHDTGLELEYSCDLVCKHLLAGGGITLDQLCTRLMLPGSVIEEVINHLRQDAKVEVLGVALEQTGLRYNLTERGRASALDAHLRSGYLGPAPITLNQYIEIVGQQSVHNRQVSSEMVDRVFEEVVIDSSIKDQLGLAMNSGRAVFVYGPPGSGKTYLTSKLSKVFADTVLIPHAIVVRDTTIAIFDPLMHRAIGAFRRKDDLTLASGHDLRLVHCERPVVVVGGELTDDMLDIQFDTAEKTYTAPLQLKANNGVFIIDDMGRQKVPPEAIFNRWIVPMEEKSDYLSIGAGRHFVVPFDEVLIFSTNLHPLDLADEAFLRRIGYKIKFDNLREDQYREIWRQECRDRRVACHEDAIDFVVNGLHSEHQTPMAACHPRDLINIATDYTVYAGQPREITKEHIQLAWDNYFVRIST
ncbi:MAG: AAA family ATPase [Pseudomonadales bacterium]|nr:AAA family ATPase [Pseudomonadales bacterium]